MAQADTFEFPAFYSFPPFFSPQPSTTTEHARQSKWSSLILSYCRHKKIWKLTLVDAIHTDLFCNKTISRQVSLADAKDIVNTMQKGGRAEWLGGKKDGESKEMAWIYWRTPEEWAGLIYDWVDDTAQKNVVLTLYEITESEATISQEFHGMDPDLLQRALGVLVKRGKAQVFGQEDEQGVKFF